MATRVGVVITAVWLFVVCLIIFFDWQYFAAMTPNEWGDFISGSLGPIALLWLILGYFLQSSELRHSVEALRLQAEELKLSVEQQRSMVTVAERQLSLDIEVRDRQTKVEVSKGLPFLVIERRGGSSGGNSAWNHDFFVRNVGNDAVSVTVDVSGENIGFNKKLIPFLQNGSAVEFYVQTISTARFPSNPGAKFYLEMENNRGQKRQQVYEVEESGSPKPILCEPPQE